MAWPVITLIIYNINYPIEDYYLAISAILYRTILKFKKSTELSYNINYPKEYCVTVIKNNSSIMDYSTILTILERNTRPQYQYQLA